MVDVLDVVVEVEVEVVEVVVVVVVNGGGPASVVVVVVATVTVVVLVELVEELDVLVCGGAVLLVVERVLDTATRVVVLVDVVELVPAWVLDVVAAVELPAGAVVLVDVAVVAGCSVVVVEPGVVSLEPLPPPQPASNTLQATMPDSAMRCHRAGLPFAARCIVNILIEQVVSMLPRVTWRAAFWLQTQHLCYSSSGRIGISNSVRKSSGAVFSGEFR